MDVKPYKIPHPFRKLNKELIDAIVQNIADGSTHKLAAESNGITVRIFDIWCAQGRVDVDHEVDSLPAYLVLSLAKIKQMEVMSCRQAIRESEKGHKGAEWTLEHAYWRDYSGQAPVLELAKQMDEMKYSMEKDKDNGKVNNRKKKKDTKK